MKRPQDSQKSIIDSRIMNVSHIFLDPNVFKKWDQRNLATKKESKE